jgi:indolepyruvate ferredoxin oxidoreductase alpha subunit
MEAAPDAKVLKLGMSWPLPVAMIEKFSKSVKRCVVVEEGDDFLRDKIRAAGIAIEGKKPSFRFGELSVGRIRKLLAGDETPDPKGAPGRPPQLCPGCPHRKTYEVLRDMGCIVPGDIGCYSLGVLPPFSSMDTLVCMGAGIGTGLGLRASLPETEAKKVVSVIGDSTFAHSGITGLVEMVYNRPESGHVVLVLDNATTAMTGLQEHPGTGRRLDMSPTGKLSIEDLAKAIGVERVDVVDPVTETERFKTLLADDLASGATCVIVVRRPCILEMKKLAKSAKHAAPAAK